MSEIIKKPGDLNFSIDDIPSMPLPRKVFMVQPDYFDVVYVINPHMEGNEGMINQDEARRQWESIRNTFETLGLGVHIIEGQPELPDMVFAANQSLPYETAEGSKKAFMSIMDSEHRKDEIPFIEQWYRQNGYEILYLPQENSLTFEGMGDAVWHTGKRLLWGGHGFRTSDRAYRAISDQFDVPIITLELTNESFYHLDTCFCVLDEETVLIHPPAFTESSVKMIYDMFPDVMIANEHEAKELFACNATCPDGKNVIIQEGTDDVKTELTSRGFVVHEVDTSEYLKSGGSVYCMKMTLW